MNMILVRKKIGKTLGQVVSVSHGMFGYRYDDENTLRYKLEHIARNILTQGQRDGIRKGRLNPRNILHPISTQLLMLTRMTLMRNYKETVKDR
jgi:hypothetical protein